ncbi:MAG: mono-functional DNA-alkylating methyl methanesulfonate N-terminal domain-containing protein [archaeon]|nr:mono-functional DNA-alkylating methyl methanesulfonate N-terminal domain-containing protein [archaeon]
MNRDGSNKLTISSPLECHKSGTLTWSLIGIDTGVDNPMFAAIETAAGSPEKQLVFYELDLGLNHLVRKLVFSAPLSAHRLVAVPAGSTGPGGVLVLCESGLFVFRHPKNEAFEIRKTIPLRLGWSAPPPLVTCLTTSRQRTRFFFLVQTETGDLFKVTLDTSSSSSSPSTQVLRISYFDTLPRAVSLSVLKLSGVLLLAAEAGDHHVYQFRSLGSNDDTVSPFSPRPVAAPLQHLSLLDTWPSLAPLTTAKLLDFDTYMLTTATDPSTLRVLKRGWMSMPLGASALPAPPTGLWALPTSGCLLLSFQGSSRLLSTAGSALAEMPTANSGFEANQTTLDAFELADGTIIQTFVNGFVRLDLSRLTASSSSSSSSSTTTTTASLSSASTSSTLLFKWDCPSPGQQIRLSAHNSHQFLLTTQSHEQYLFEIDSTFHLSLFASASLPFLPSAVELFPIAKGLRRARFLVAADPNSLKVGLFAIEPAASFLQSPMTSIPVPDMPTSLAITLSLTTSELYYLHVGMSNGMLSRVPVDLLSGTPTGPAFPIIVQNGAAVRMRKVSPHHFFILGAQTKYCFNAVETFHQQPVPAYPGLSGVTAFVSPHCPQHGFAAVASHNLVMFVLKPDQSNFHTYSQQQLPSIPRQHIHTSNLIFHLFACSSASPIPEHP